MAGNMVTDVSRKRSALVDMKNALTKAKAGDPIVVYCLTRSETEDLSALLVRMGHKAASYHGGMPHALRHRVHNQVRVHIVGSASATSFGSPSSRPVSHASLRLAAK